MRVTLSILVSALSVVISLAKNPDYTQEFTLNYRSEKNLVVVSLTINNKELQLILDSGSPNTLLFGKHHQANFRVLPQINKRIMGYGTRGDISAKLSLLNRLILGTLTLSDIAILLVDEKPTGWSDQIDGVIGYDLFRRFEIEINPKLRTVTFRPPLLNCSHDDFQMIPMIVKGSKASISSVLSTSERTARPELLTVDTGSALGILLTSNERRINSDIELVGLNGKLMGATRMIHKMQAASLVLFDIMITEVRCEAKSNGSIGMEILSDYVIIINYCQSYLGLKKWKHDDRGRSQPISKSTS